MKKVFIVALLLIGAVTFAQNRKERPARAAMEQLSPEQRNQLMLKRMTLDLDLNAKQQEQMGQIIAEQNAKREARQAQKQEGKNASREERFEMRNKMLDEQIAMKSKVKNILTPEQLAKWEKHKEQMQESRDMHRKGRNRN